jgi:putative ABC transport system substrate-binding protein
MRDMRRREFIALLGSTAAAWPLAARAQQAVMPVIGFPHSQSSDGFSELLRGFRQGLNEAGYIEYTNVAVENRWGDNQSDRLPSLVEELVRRQVTVIAAFGSPATFAARAATTTIPIVFNRRRPSESGLVASIGRPGGNLTRVNFLTGELAAKRLELLREVVPGASG